MCKVDPNSFGGKVWLTLLDKVILGAAVGITGVLLKSYWDHSQVETALLHDMPEQVNALSAEYFGIVSRIPLETGTAKLALVARGGTTVAEINVWFDYAESVTGNRCDPAFVTNLEQSLDVIAELKLADATKLEEDLRDAFPTAVKCIREQMIESIYFPFGL